MSQQNRVQVVEWLATHHEPHPDEAQNLWMAVRFGQKVFLGVERAWWAGRVFFCDAGRELPKQLPCKRERMLEAGVGGREFDEHRDGQTGEECAASLMANRLGLRGDPALEQMLGWALRNDQNGEGTAFDWADIMKASFNAGLPAMLVLKRSFRVFDAVYNTLSGSAKYKDITGMRPYWQLAADFVLRQTKNDFRDNPKYYFSGPLQAAEATGLSRDESLSWILNYEVSTKGLEGEPPRTPGIMEIPSIVDALYHDGASVGEVTRFVDEMHNARLVEQKLFLEAVDKWAVIMEAARKRERHPDGSTFTVEEAGVTYKVAVVFSDNRRMVSAIRSSSYRPHVIVRVIPKTMHISLFAKGLDVTPIVTRVRAACWAAVGNTSVLSAEKLAHEWTIEEVPQLCFQKKGGNILNSSLSAPGVSPIRLRVKAYMTCVVDGLREIARLAAQHRKETRKRSRERRAHEATVQAS